MYKRKIIYFPYDNAIPRIYVNPKNESVLLRSGRALHLTKELEEKMKGIPLHRWELDYVNKTINDSADLGEARLEMEHKPEFRGLNTWELSAIISTIAVLSGIIGYFIGEFY